MADSFLGLFDFCQLPFGSVTGARACLGSPQEGPARSAATATGLAERSAGGPCGPTWASPTHLTSGGAGRANRRSRCCPVTRRPGGSEPAKLFGPPIDDPEIDVGKAHQPIAGFGFGNTNRLADQRLAEKDHVAAPADLAIAADLAHGMISIVPGRFKLTGIGPRRGSIAAGRRHLAQRFMRAVVVKVVAEAVKADLLLGRGGRRRARGLGLERGMHALVPAILLWRTRLNPLQTNAQLDPLHRQPGEPARAAARGKRDAVVAADRARQTELAEGLLDHWLHRLDCLRHDAALDQKATVGIGDRQWIAALPVGGAEPPLEIDAPQVVGLVYRQKRLGQRHRAPAPAARLAQPRTQLLGTPKRPLAPQCHDRRGHLLGHRHAMPVRCPRTRLQPATTLFPIASQQPVAGVAADAVALTQHRHRQLPPQTLGDERDLLVHDTGFLPRHRQSPPLPTAKNLSGIYPVHNVRYLSGSDRGSAPHPSPLPANEEREGTGVCV